MKPMSVTMGWLAAAAALAAGSGCGGHARTVLDEVPGANKAELAGQLATGGYSIGEIRTAALPFGAEVVLVTPQPSDGYAPQVSAYLLQGGAPIVETEAVCDPFLWASRVTGDQFYGLDPAHITGATWEAWLGGERRDLVVDVEMEVSNPAYGGESAKAVMHGRCVFRLLEDPTYGKIFAAVFGYIDHATTESTYSGTSTEMLEEQSMRPLEGEPDQFDLQDLARTVTCSPDAAGGRLCIPETDITIRRYTLSGEGIDTGYIPLGESGYGYRYAQPPYDPPGIYGTPPEYTPPEYAPPEYTPPEYTPPEYPEGVYGSPPTEGYDDTSSGYDDTSTGGYEETSEGSGEPTTDDDAPL
jgi:hypothetical protein